MRLICATCSITMMCISASSRPTHNKAYYTFRCNDCEASVNVICDLEKAELELAKANIELAQYRESE